MPDDLPNIRNREKFIDSIVDWSPLNNCFQGKVQVSDVDGIVERNGHVALFEQKSVGAGVPKGQDILLDRITRPRACPNSGCEAPVDPMFTAFVLFGELESPHEAEIRRSDVTMRISVDLERFKDIVRFWDWSARKDDFEVFDQRMWANANR